MKSVLPIAALLVAACAPVTEPVGISDAAGPDVRTEGVAEAGNSFGLDLYQRLAAEQGDTLISPVSILGAFGVVTAGARGETREAIGRALRLPADDARLHADLGGMLRDLERSGEGTTLNVANALWVQQDFAIKPDFARVAESDYGATAEPLDFVNAPDAAAGRINAWVAQRTNDRISELISRDAITQDTRLVITNAVYFLGDWRSPFNASNTSDQPFHLAAGGTRTLPLMHQTGSFRYSETERFQAIDLPYQDERLSMTVLLPRARDGLASLEAELDDAALGDWLAGLDAGEPRRVRVYLPKVRMEVSYDLIPALRAMGMGVAFGSGADFTGIADAPLAISHVVHKTFLRIDEKGTEAAAATGIAIEVTSAPIDPPPTFRADHPFLFMIRDRETGAILFLGRVSEPESAT